MNMRDCSCDQEIKNPRLKKKIVKNARTSKFWGFLFPIPLAATIIISIIFNILIWRALGLEKSPDRPFEDELIHKFY